MCGIVGILLPRHAPFPAEVAADIVRKMARSIRHRGPDGEGLWSDPAGRCVLAQQRLAIIDTSDAGLQPFVSGNGRWWITFNGEIYNFQSLRQKLESAGVRLRGRTDTEVLLEGLVLYGVDWLHQLDGMFAFAAFDTLSGETILARDAFGEKPLYYIRLEERGLAFASELQAIELVPGFDGMVDLDAAAEALSFQYIGAPRTIYENVKKLPPGHWMRISADGETTIQRYFSFQPGNDPFVGRSMASLADELEDILVRSIQGRMIADVPLGAFLSGGVDSSTVCALVRSKLKQPLMTFSIGFKGASESEHETARIFAKHLGTEHFEEIIEPGGADFLYNIGRILDEPNADSSCFPTYMLSKFCRKHVTVAISGDGGDEMFGGYGRYFATLDEAREHSGGALPGWKPGNVYYRDRILVAHEPHIAELFGFVPGGYQNHLRALRGDLNESQPGLLSAMRRHDTDNYLPGAVIPKVDRMSMQHALEVRTPYLNVELARFAERLPDDVMVQGGRGKLILKEISYRYLPREIIDMPKQGFGLPMSDWARSTMLDTAGKLLLADDGRLSAAFGRDGVNRFIARQSAEGGFSAYQSWGVAMLESWLRHHPARFPDMEKKKTAYRKQSTSSYAHPLRKNLFLVSRKRDIELYAAHDSVEIVSPSLFQRAVRLSISEFTERSAESDAIELPDLTKSLSQNDLERLRILDGATLIINDREISGAIDAAFIANLRSMRVCRIMYNNLYYTDRIDDYLLKPIKRLDFGTLLKLWRRRVAVFSNRRLAKLLINAQPIFAADGHRRVTPAIAGLQGAPDREIGSDYAVFEGLTQLPSIHASHVDIGEKGGGLYSIYNGMLHFSPTETQRQYRVPYWIVPVDAETRDLLPFSPVPTLEPALSKEEARARLEQFFRPEDGSAFELQPGDHIAVCTHALPPGGAERQWVYLAEGLRDAGYKVTFVTYEPLTGDNAHYLPMLRELGIDVLDAGSESTLSLAANLPPIPDIVDIIRGGPNLEWVTVLKLTAALNGLRPRAVIAQLDQPNLAFATAARLAGIERIAVSFRSYNPTNFAYIHADWMLPAYQLLSRSGAMRFTGNFQGSVDDYADWIGIDRSRAVAIPNAIDDREFSREVLAGPSQLPQGVCFDKETPIVLGVFRLSAEKGPLEFIDVAELVSREHPEVRFVIVGVGPLRKQMDAAIAAKGLDGKVVFLGRRDDVPALIAMSDLLLLTSNKEGMPNVVLEAQSIGRPVVATDAGGTATIVVDGETGFIRAIGDGDGLAACCLRVLNDKALASRMGTAAAERAAGTYSKARLAQGYLDALK